MFEVCMQQIISRPGEQNSQEIDFVEEQSREEMRCKKLFDDEVFKTLLGLVSKSDVSADNKERLIKIVNNYLKHNFDLKRFEEQLKVLIKIFYEVDGNQSLRTNGFFILILLFI